MLIAFSLQASVDGFSPFVLPDFSGEKPFLCDKCGRGFNRVDNLRSHVKTVHHGKAGMKRLVIAGGSNDEGADEIAVASTSESEINIVTVSTEDIVTLATEALAASAVAQLTGQTASLSSVICGRMYLRQMLQIALQIYADDKRSVKLKGLRVSD